MSLVKKIGKAIGVFNKGGFHAVAVMIGRYRRTAIEQDIYRKTLGKPGPMSESELSDLRRRISSFRRQPLISIILPVYDVDEIWLRKCIDSVRQQIYEHWELCIADDCSPSPHVAKVLEEYSELDTRIKVIFRPENGHISAASNSALEIATGEFAVLLDHDDELTEDALFWVANELNEHPDAAMIYSDEDMIDGSGRRFAPKFKPDFSRDLFYSLNLITHLSAYRTDLLRKIGGFRVGLEGSQDYDLALRVIEEIPERSIRHIPRVLYHWRAIPGSVALSGDEKPYAHDRARLAIGEHLARCGAAADVEPTHFNLHRVRYRLPDKMPSVSMLVHGSESGSSDDRVRSADGIGVEVIGVSQTGEFAASLNDAVESSSGGVIIFVDASLEPAKDWVRELVRVALQPGISAVGVKIVDSDERVIDGGLVFGGKRLFSVAHLGYYTNESGNMGRNMVIGNYSAVSLSCMALRRVEFDAVGGFDREIGERFAGADICLRLGAAGKRIVHDPYVEMRLPKGKDLIHLSEPTQAEQKLFEDRWRSVMARDPFYNPNLEIKNGSFTISRDYARSQTP